MAVTESLSEVQRRVLAAVDAHTRAVESAAADEIAPDIDPLGTVETDAVLADLQKLGLLEVTTGGSGGHAVIRSYRLTDLGRDAVGTSA